MREVRLEELDERWLDEISGLVADPEAALHLKLGRRIDAELWSRLPSDAGP